MTILDKLRTIFEGKFRDLLANNTLKLFDFSKNTNYTLEFKDGERLGIDLGKATEQEKKALKEIIDSNIQEKEETFLTDKVNKKTLQIKQNLPNPTDEELLNFYKGKINPDMLRALEMSLVVRNVFRKGEDILELKRDISLRFPSFGNNVCNLTSSDYFDKYFRELYDTLINEPDFDISKYKSEVERIIIELPYMVFINRYKSLEEFLGEVKYKLSRLKKYGTDRLKLHAIGKDNVEKSLLIIEQYENQEEIIIDKDINKSRTIATITFKF